MDKSREELEALLERHHAETFGWALACCGGDEVEAADVLQDAYLRILEGSAPYGGRSRFKTFLFGVIRRTALEHRRRRAMWRKGLLRYFGRGREPSPESGDVAAAVDRSEASRHLRSALETLPRRQCEVLHLVFYQGLSIREASETLDISIGTARTHYERGKKRLRDLLSAGQGGRDERLR